MKAKDIIVKYDYGEKIFKIEAETQKACLVKPKDDMKLWLPKSIMTFSQKDKEFLKSEECKKETFMISEESYDYFYMNELLKIKLWKAGN
jgi:hypothetical protein